MFRLKFMPEAFVRIFVMIDKQLLVCVIHIAIIAVILEAAKFLFPSWTTFYAITANILLILALSHFSYDFVKDLYLTEKINPKNKAVFITGCDSGFGHLLAKRLDSVGFHVFASCLIPDGSGAQQLKETCSRRLQVLQLDVTKDDSVQDALAFVEKHLKSSVLWAVVNNAGIQKGFDAEFATLKDFMDTMEVNTFGMIRVTKTFLPLLKSSKGRVVNVTSLGGRLSLRGCCPYIISKFAAVAFTECLRQEMEVWGIKVISVEPELFRTPLSSPETVVESMETCFSNLSEDIKEDYGEDYFQNYKRLAFLVCSMSSQNTSLVTDALEDAISLKFCNSVYKPRRNIFCRIIIYIAENSPKKCVNMIACFIAYASGLPVPEKADKLFEKYLLSFREFLHLIKLEKN